jgi:hypothetical protein
LIDELICSQYNIIPNNSKKYYNGSTWNSSSCGGFTIIGKTDKHNAKGSHIYCLCRFEDGTIVESDFTNIKKGNIKNPNCPSVYGVGYVGQGRWSSVSNGKNTKEYRTWVHMIRRCYSERFQKKNTSYRGTTVDEKWFCFQNFCDDIQNLFGYEDWKNNLGYELDKDILCEKMKIYPKIYAPETCIFVSKKINVSESTSRKNLTGLTYVGVSPEKEKYEFINQQEFAKAHDLSITCVRSCINKTKDQYNGWIFYIKSD